MITIQENLREFHFWFERYWPLTRKSRPEALAHQARNFSVFAAKRMKGVQMAKGAITQERLGAFKSGEGLDISDRAREIVFKRHGVTQNVRSRRLYLTKFTKKEGAEIARLNSATGGGALTIQALLAAQELRLRESHRAFTTSSLRFRKIDEKSPSYSMTKHGSMLGQGKPSPKGSEADEFVFTWGSQIGRFSAMAATGLGKAKAQRQLNAALTDTRADMRKYITRKQQEAARTAAARIRRL